MLGACIRRRCLLVVLVFLPWHVEAIRRFRALDVLNLPPPKNSTISHLTQLPSETEDDDDVVQELYFQQTLDHFRAEEQDDKNSRHRLRTGTTENKNASRCHPTVPATFSQRYFYSNIYVRNITDTAKVQRHYAFLCVGGEGPPLDKSVLVDSVHCSGDMIALAERLYHQNSTTPMSIHLFALEHRYYGESFPQFPGSCHNHSSSPLTNQHLTYLSSRQALADLAHFVSVTSRTRLHDAHKIKWVTFGGSYPGMLAAWARLKYPHLVHAAVSSSAPIQPVLDFAAYNNHVARDFGDTDVGGSPQCLEVIVKGHEEIVYAISRDPESVAQDFGLCNATELDQPANVDLFVGDGVFDFSVQGNDPACHTPLCNVEGICRAIQNQVDLRKRPMAILAWLVQQEPQRTECLTLDWQATLDEIRNPDSDSWWRSWLWQTCSEFGFYQTCEANSQCLYARGHHLLMQDLQICAYAFGQPAHQVAANVQTTLEYYGGWDLAATRILSVTGSVDPWSEMAKTKTSDPQDLPVHRVPVASHHFWTHPIKAETDSIEVQKARQVIYDTVTNWLNEATADAGQPNAASDIAPEGELLVTA